MAREGKRKKIEKIKIIYTLRQTISGETVFITKISKFYENLIFSIGSEISTLLSVELFPQLLETEIIQTMPYQKIIDWIRLEITN